jgi:ferredoxin/flavodoxin---NADP+ reductase
MTTVAADPTNATLVKREMINPELALFFIKPDVGPLPEFTSGQFCTIGLPAIVKADAPEGPARADGRVKLTRRAYSIASSPDVRDCLELFIVKVPEGELTPRIFDLPEGARMYLDPKIKGHFTLGDQPAGKNLVFMSTGTGLAPFISMIRYHWDKPNRPWNKLVVIHGVRVAADFGYAQELNALAAKDPNFVYLPAATREPEGSAWKGLRGRTPALLEPETFKKLTGWELESLTSHVYLCGNPEMIKSVQAMLEPRGFINHSNKVPGNIHSERYW